MPGHLWTKVTGPSAGLVQQHFVEARKEALYRRDKGLEKKVAEALRTHAKFAGMKLTGDKWLPVYEKISLRLQASDLTINFKADSWFTNENHYETYSQQYERSGRSQAGAAQFKGDTKLNPAKVRADADDRITFNNLRGAAPAPAAPRRGLMPGRQGLDRIQEQMEFRSGNNQQSSQATPTNPNNPTTIIDSANSHFNPKTKQVFAALNYGRCPHGSTIEYGSSHLVLSPKFKVNALYYGGDTFFHQDASGQVAFHVIGSIIAFVKPALLDAIVDACYFDIPQKNHARAALLLEAHLFTELSFTGNIERIVLDAQHGSAIHANAKKFAAKHGTKLLLTSAA